MYVARLTRPDVHLATAYLTTKAQHPKGVIIKRRIISYLKGTTSYGIVVNCCELKFHLHCDASWVFHHDGSSHNRWVLKLGESFLGSKSSKQRVGSPSPTDGEIISIVDGLKNLKSSDNLTLERGLPLSICHLCQDNLSASKISSKSAKTKQVKYSLTLLTLSSAFL